ncbi:transcriptional regulator [Acrocarpospora corrugata]|uniref:Transcriptional regulator n=1 Tax=Acrocarpospora corrugata TaxID=35763 RepID=A0A5M3VSI8_9ACTN|nr:PadR family transcriptional regulator [Acrocarpospora corrugata]GER98591.1 transcriptional regulator [Acrocarpospora corrugata]
MEDNLMWVGGPPFPPHSPIPPHPGGPFEAHPGGPFDVPPPHAVPLPGPRVKRGDVRQALLRLLHEEARNGYQMIEEISRRSNGIWRPSPGSVYPALQQLEDEGLVRAEESGGSRTYRLTDEGRRRADEWSGVEPWDEVARSMPEDRHELRLLWGQLGEAFVHLTRVASDKQVAQTKKLLKNTRREIFKILASDEEEDER